MYVITLYVKVSNSADEHHARDTIISNHWTRKYMYMA